MKLINVDPRSWKTRNNMTINVGLGLGNDPTLPVLCPDCGEANLAVQDVEVEGWNKFERIMRCPSCESWNALLMTRKN